MLDIDKQYAFNEQGEAISVQIRSRLSSFNRLSGFLAPSQILDLGATQARVRERARLGFICLTVF
jgi:hypothetical protein